MLGLLHIQINKQTTNQSTTKSSNINQLYGDDMGYIHRGRFNTHTKNDAFKKGIRSLKLTQHLHMDGWNTSFLLGWPIFRCYFRSRECISLQMMASLWGEVIVHIISGVIQVCRYLRNGGLTPKFEKWCVNMVRLIWYPP